MGTRYAENAIFDYKYMPELTQELIRETFVSALEPFAEAMSKDFQAVNKRLDSVETDVRGLKEDMQEVKADVQGLKEDMQEVKADVQGLKEDMREVKADVREMKNNSSELFTKLDKFISLYENTKQELTVLSSQMRRLEERVALLEVRRV